MKSTLSKVILVIAILFFNSLFSQNIYKTIENKYGFIILSEKIDIEYYFKRILQNEEEIEILTKSEINDFKNSIKNYKFLKKYWSKEELGNEFYILNGEKKHKIPKDSIKLYSIKNKLSKSETKNIWKKVRRFNENVNEWRHFPISISEPLYNSDKTLILIAINRGNDGGNVNLYKKENEN